MRNFEVLVSDGINQFVKTVSLEDTRRVRIPVAPYEPKFHVRFLHEIPTDDISLIQEMTDTLHAANEVSRMRCLTIRAHFRRREF